MGIICLLPLLFLKLLLFPLGYADCATKAIERCQLVWGKLHFFAITKLAGINICYQGLQPDQEKWYLLISNHQSWVDILLLHGIFKKPPPLKFFVKQETIWIPVVGLACWGMGFPFMRRFSKEAQKRHAHKKGIDIKTTQQKCKVFLRRPTMLINFVEGTRITKAKHANDTGNFRNLLSPKVGGLGIAMAIMHEKVEEIIDLTMVYHQNKTSMWDLCTGNMKEVIITAKSYPMNQFDGHGLMDKNELAIKHLKDWLLQRWLEKDEQIDRVMKF